MYELTRSDFDRYLNDLEYPIDWAPGATLIKLPEVDDDLWEPYLVPISSEWIDELTYVTHYERRHRLYVNVIMEALGFPPAYPGRYWEKLPDGTITLHE